MKKLKIETQRNTLTDSSLDTHHQTRIGALNCKLDKTHHQLAPRLTRSPLIKTDL